jgi:potassium-transporting ATPase KdpC subunit
MALKKDTITAAIAVLVLTLLLGILYPLFITGISQVAFPGNANGQRVYVKGKLVGSKIIGQNFGDQVFKNGKAVTQNGAPVINPDPRYFQGRPSATVPPANAAATTFSNLGPNSKATLAAIEGNIQTYLALNCTTVLTSSGACASPYDPKVTGSSQVPVDAANSSASGIDPDISVRNADIQAYRVAAIRHLSLTKVMELISTYTHGRGLGFSGEPGVNVLQLNLALDRSTGGSA